MSERARLLIIDTDNTFASNLSCDLTETGYEIFTALSLDTGVKILIEKKILVVLLGMNQATEETLEALKSLKIYLPFIEVIILAQKGNFKLACRAMTVGAHDFLVKSPHVDEIIPVINRAYKQASKNHKKKSLQGEESWPVIKSSSPEFIGQSTAVKDVLHLINKIAPTNAPVLIMGETGVGKELVAHFIHQNSPRHKLPFIPINCGAIPETLLENELFGHTKGAFTDSVNTKQGLLEMVNGGTLFLDEVTELSPQLQVKLLRVIETGTFRRLGDNQERWVDFRIVSATNRKIDSEIKTGRFRSDFYYRLAVMTIHIHPLRMRQSDIPLLLEHFLKLCTKSNGGVQKRFSPSALQMLLEYDWPGNVREIKNFAERVYILSENEIITPADVASSLPSLEDYKILWEELEAMKTDSNNPELLEEIEKKYIKCVLSANKGDIELAGQFLGIPQPTLMDKIKRYSIMPDKDNESTALTTLESENKPR